MKRFRMKAYLLFTLILAAYTLPGCGGDAGNGHWDQPTVTAAAITEFSLNGNVGTISEGTTPKTIDVVMPFGTNLADPLTATYVTTGNLVEVGTTSQVSGVTTNVFPLSPPASAIYTVTAADGVTTATYNVNVTVAAANAAAITAFSLDGTVGTISEGTTPKTIDVVMPLGTDLALPLTATFVTTGNLVGVGTTPQASGVTANVFPLSPPASAIYTVTAADGVTTATYNVNVTVAAANAAAITAFSLDGTVGTISEGTTPKTIDVVLPLGTDLALPLTATFVTTGNLVEVGTTPQVSGVTANVFPLSPPASAIYTVTAADGVTTATYNVNVTVAEPVPVALIDLGSVSTFGIMATSAITNTGAATMINGDVSLDPGTSNGLLPVQVNGTIHINDTVSAQARIDLLAAYNSAKALAPGVTVPGGMDLGAFPNGGLPGVLPPGTYTSGSTMLISTPLTLDAGGDANASWVFQIGSSLTTTNSVSLSNGAQAKNVYWVPTASATIGVGTIFNGNILTGENATGQTGAIINGRILAGAILPGTIALDTNTVNVPAQ